MTIPKNSAWSRKLILVAIVGHILLAFVGVALASN
jgi:hypothetical protein